MIDTTKYKQKLEEEKKKLEEELSSVGRRNEDDPSDWEPKGGDSDHENADSNEVADRIEELGENVGIESTLEPRLNEVRDALARIENGNYGICNVGGEAHEIEVERLDANPAAKTCIKHLEEEM